MVYSVSEKYRKEMTSTQYVVGEEPEAVYITGSNRIGWEVSLEK